jgi:signal peptidase I
MTLVCPSIGYMSVGRLAGGMVANALLVAIQTALLVATAYWQVFPGTALLFGAVAWLVIGGMMAAEVALEAGDDSTGEATDAGYHWMSALAVGLLTFALPIALLFGVATANLYTLVTVQSDGMYPTLRAGDRVLVAKSLAAPGPLERGELATIRTESAGVRILRNVALPGQQVSMAGRQVSVNGQDIPIRSIDSDEAAEQLDGFPDRSTFEYWVERAGSHKFIVSYAATGSADLLVPPVKLRESQWFGLCDNRSQRHTERSDTRIVDSRQLGPLAVDQVIGRPTFVAWSVHPNDGSIDWGRTWARMGLRLQ